MTIKHQCITPMFNIHVDNDIKMKHFTIFKTRTMQESKIKLALIVHISYQS